MSSFAVKVALICSLMLAAHRANSERNEAAECRGKPELGQPCQDGAGICTMAGGPGKRFGLLECVPTTTPPPTTIHPPSPFNTELAAPGIPGTSYPPNTDISMCWYSPEGTVITLLFPDIVIECLAFLYDCTDPNNCPWDYLYIYDGVQAPLTLCSTHTNYYYYGQSNTVCLDFSTDGSGNDGHFTVIATHT